MEIVFLVTASFISLFAKSCAQVNFADDLYLDVSPRPMPDDLLSMMKYKTEFDKHMEECMNDFVQCSSVVIKERPFCGQDPLLSKKRFFYSICEMEYENCKDNKETWQYYNDLIC